MNLFVGNLSYDAVDSDLIDLFSQHGKVANARVIRDRDSRQSRGFGFVDMPQRHEAEKAMQALDGTNFNGRRLRVNPATRQR